MAPPRRTALLLTLCVAALATAFAQEPDSDGPDIPSCIMDCEGLTDMASASPKAQCEYLISKQDDECAKDCSEFELNMLTSFVDRGCIDERDGPPRGSDNDDNQIPLCITDCEGLADMASASPKAQCEYLISKQDDECAKDCSDPELEFLTSFVSRGCIDGDDDEAPACLKDCNTDDITEEGICDFIQSTVDGLECASDCKKMEKLEIMRYASGNKCDIQMGEGDTAEAKEAAMEKQAAAKEKAAKAKEMRAKAKAKAKEAKEKAIKARAAIKAKKEALIESLKGKVKDAKALRKATVLAEAMAAGKKVKKVKAPMKATSEDDACAKLCKLMGLSDCELIACSATPKTSRRSLLAEVDYETTTFVNPETVDTTKAEAALTSAGVVATTTDEAPSEEMAKIDGIEASDLTDLEDAVTAETVATKELASAEKEEAAAVTEYASAEKEEKSADAELSAAETLINKVMSYQSPSATNAITTAALVAALAVML